MASENNDVELKQGSWFKSGCSLFSWVVASLQATRGATARSPIHGDMPQVIGIQLSFLMTAAIQSTQWRDQNSYLDLHELVILTSKVPYPLRRTLRSQHPSTRDPDPQHGRNICKAHPSQQSAKLMLVHHSSSAGCIWMEIGPGGTTAVGVTKGTHVWGTVVGSKPHLNTDLLQVGFAVHHNQGPPLCKLWASRPENSSLQQIHAFEKCRPEFVLVLIVVALEPRPSKESPLEIVSRP